MSLKRSFLFLSGVYCLYRLLFKEMWLLFFITSLIYMRSNILKMTVSNCFNGLIFKNIFKRAHDYTDCMLISHIEIVKSWLFILPRHLLQAYAIMNAPNLEMYRFCIIISSVT